MRIRLAAPTIGAPEVEAVEEVLRSGMLVQGERVAAFESACADVVGVEHAVAVSSGTAALHLALVASGVGPGDRVAVPAYSWPATANVVVLVGAEPAFVDIDAATFCVDPGALKETLARRRVRAVLPVHAFGGMAAMAEVCAMGDETGCMTIEDAACALGATLDGRPAGAWGRLGCFSFHPRKTITTGEGGMVVTGDGETADRLRALRNHGLDPRAGTPDFVEAGFNYRMTELGAALGLAQLQRLGTLLTERRRQAAVYDRLLRDSAFAAPAGTVGVSHSYQSYVVLLPPGLRGRVPEVVARMGAAGIETTFGTHHIPLTTYFRRRGGYGAGDFPGADDAAARALTLPLHAALEEDQQVEVVSTLVAVAHELRSCE